jgi:hypothetical protein
VNRHSLDSLIVLLLVGVFNCANKFTLSSLAVAALVRANLAEIPNLDAPVMASCHEFQAT